MGIEILTLEVRLSREAEHLIKDIERFVWRSRMSQLEDNGGVKLVDSMLMGILPLDALKQIIRVARTPNVVCEFVVEDTPL
jgi:hypothetical protein